MLETLNREIQIHRHMKNPIITPADVQPTDDSYEVVGVFNPGVTEFRGKTLLMLRVAQRPKDRHDGFLRVPIYSGITKRMEIIQFDLSDASIDFSDSRVVKLANGEKYLTSYSFFRIATSEDGEHFDIDQNLAIVPDNDYEAFGMEDARITNLDGKYYINYSGASDFGIVTSCMVTEDFKTFQKIGNIMCPDNKDVSLFPEKINGLYATLHRPSTSEFGKPEIWFAKSQDLMCWGDHKRVLGVRPGMWDGKRVGASSAPIRTERGWLLIYHGADDSNRYSLGSVLLDLAEPWKVIARCKKPFMEPAMTYEKDGFFGNVVFACGCTVKGDTVQIYYGAVDMYICKAEISLEELIQNCYR